MASIRTGSESGLDLERNRPYRTDACSIRAAGGSPPSASLEDISRDEKMNILTGQVSEWLSSMQTEANVDDSQAVRNSISLTAQSRLTSADLFPPSRLSGSAHFHFMSSTIIADLFPPSRLSGSVHFHFMSSTIIADLFLLSRLSGSAHFHFMSSTIFADMLLPLFTLSGCVIPFHELHHDQGSDVPAIFD